MASSNEVKAYLKYAELANAAYAFEELYSNDKKYKGLSNQEKIIKILNETRNKGDRLL
jgi:hypothetical protein